MAYTFAQSANTDAAAGSTTVATTTLTAITAGQLIAVWVKHEGAATTIAVTGGGNTFTARTKTSHGNGDTHGQWFYVLSAAGGTYQLTATFGASSPFRTIQAWVFSYTGTAAYDTEAGASGTTSGNGEVVSSGNLTTTGTDEVVLGGYAEYSDDAITAEQIDDTAADGVQDTTGGANFTVSWYKIFTGTFTNDARCTMATNPKDWIVRAVAFKATAGGGETVTFDKWWTQAPPNKPQRVVPIASGIIGIRNT